MNRASPNFYWPRVPPRLLSRLMDTKSRAKTNTYRYGLFLAVLLIAAMFSGCQNVYYNIKEQFGQHKRDILVSRVDRARQSQEDAKEQFQTTLERFREVTGASGDTTLRQQYDQLEREFNRSERRAKAVSDRIDAVREVGDDLFGEWKAELEQYRDDSLREQSEEQLRETRASFDRVLRSMERAEASMDPVLSAFRDRVLFLKHNLNAQAVASLEGMRLELEQEIEQLIANMNEAINEANRFIQAMEAPIP